MLQDLEGQVAWITGAGTGIGESAAIKMAAAGCKVVLSGRRKDVLENVMTSLLEPLKRAESSPSSCVAVETMPAKNSPDP